MKNKSILVVEDESLIAENIRMILQEYGYIVVGVVSSGEAAIESVRQHRPDMIVMDIMLEGVMTGIEAALQIFKLYGTPVIYLTAYSDDNTLEEAKVTQPYGYIVKPFEEGELYATLEMAFYKVMVDKVLRESEEKYRNLVEGVEESIIMLNQDNVFTFVNEATCKIFGFEKDEMIGTSLLEYTDPSGTAALRKASRGLSDKQNMYYDLKIVCKNRSFRFLEISASPMIVNDVFSGSFVVIKDITKQHEREKQLIYKQQLLNKEIEILKKKVAAYDGSDKIMGDSQQIQKVHKLVKLIAPTNMSVLLQGKSGTGKEVIANMIHERSKRSKNIIVAVDCGAIPDTLVESELFGHEKGSFTGADSMKRGKFEEAHGGTLFLDEITNLPFDSQAKFLRALEQRIISRVGSNKPIKVDVRVIASSNLEFEAAVENGKFREDLYHRLNEFKIVLPRLAERKDDIPVLAQQFIYESNLDLNKNIEGFTNEAMQLIINYSWPGNIRELKHAIKRAVLLETTKFITPLSLDKHIVPDEEEHETDKIDSYIADIMYNDHSLSQVTSQISRSVEKKVISRILEKVKYNKSKAATILGIDRKTLYSKIKDMKINTGNE